MATIGSFTKFGNDHTGDIVTLGLQAKNVRIVPVSRPGADNAPSHRGYLGRSEVGAAWSKRSAEGRPYMSLLLDAPILIAPVYANLLASEEGGDHDLVWSRGGRRRPTDIDLAPGPRRPAPSVKGKMEGNAGLHRLPT